MKPKHYQPPKVELWPENESPLALFTQFATQWRTGPGGAVGLDYGVLFHELDRRDLPAEEYDDTMWAVRVIERAALREGARPADARSEPARAERQGAPVRPEVVRVREPAAAWQPEERAEATPEPPVVVSIGRIDVRVHTTPAAPRQRAQQRGMTLEEYLRKRSRGDD